MDNPFAINDGDWIEDFSHENGNYNNFCAYCGKQFIGHKRRVVCKSCSKNDSSQCPKDKKPCIPEICDLKCMKETPEDTKIVEHFKVVENAGWFWAAPKLEAEAVGGGASREQAIHSLVLSLVSQVRTYRQIAENSSSEKYNQLNTKYLEALELIGQYQIAFEKLQNFRETVGKIVDEAFEETKKPSNLFDAALDAVSNLP